MLAAAAILPQLAASETVRETPRVSDSQVNRPSLTKISSRPLVDLKGEPPLPLDM